MPGYCNCLVTHLMLLLLPPCNLFSTHSNPSKAVKLKQSIALLHLTPPEPLIRATVRARPLPLAGRALQNQALHQPPHALAPRWSFTLQGLCTYLLLPLPRIFSLHRAKCASPVAQLVKNPLAMRETWARSLGWEDPLEKGKATHPSILAWRIPWTV